MEATRRDENHPIRKIIPLLGLFTLAFLAMEVLILGSGYIGNCLLNQSDPKTSSFIQSYQLKNFQVAQHNWKDLSQISKNLIRAVLVSEDDAFFEHEGIDVKEMKESWEMNLRKRKIVRGGSTLTMQLVKNLYLSANKSPLRKFNEILLALDLENKVSKKRILEVYLNIVEWGEGLYGAQAASRHYFKKDAEELSPSEAAYLAALLPNPVVYSKKGSRRAQRRKTIILRRMAKKSLPKEF